MIKGVGGGPVPSREVRPLESGTSEPRIAPEVSQDAADEVETEPAKPIPQPWSWWRRMTMLGLAVVPIVGATVTAYSSGFVTDPSISVSVDTLPRRTGWAEAKPPESPLSTVIDSANALKEKFNDINNFITRDYKAGEFKNSVWGYDSVLDLGHGRLSLPNTFSPGYHDNKVSIRTGLGAKVQGDFVSEVLQRQVQQSAETTRTQGIRAGINGRYQIAYTQTLFQPDPGDGWAQDYDASAHSEVFTTWRHKMGPKAVLDTTVTVGVGQDLVHPDTSANAETVQEYRRDISGELPYLGNQLALTVRAREGFHYDFNQGASDPYYEVFTSVAKKHPIKLFGKEREVALALGVHVAGHSGDPVEVRPDVGFNYRW